MENKELKQLTITQLDELHMLLGQVSDIINSEKLKLSELSKQGKDIALTIELLSLEVFSEIVRKQNKK